MSLENLHPFLAYEGVLAAFVIRDGAVLEEAGLPGTDTGGLVASLSLLMTESGMIADRLRKKSLRMILLEYENRLLLIQALDDNRFIAVITNAQANIGQISYHLRKELMKTGSGT